MSRQYSDEELLAHLRALADDLDGSPTAAQMNDRGPVSADTYVRRFGSWNDALRAADLDLNRERDIPEEALLAEVHRLADRLDRVPMAVDVQDHGAYSLDPYVDRFESWSDALRAAGFTVRRASAEPGPNVRFLREHGPTVVDDLPAGSPGTRDKIDGVATFHVGEGHVAVGYLLDEHEEADVVRAFLTANPSLLDEQARHNLVQLVGRQGRRWQAAARPVLDELLSGRTERRTDR